LECFDPILADRIKRGKTPRGKNVEVNAAIDLSEPCVSRSKLPLSLAAAIELFN